MGPAPTASQGVTTELAQPSLMQRSCLGGIGGAWLGSARQPFQSLGHELTISRQEVSETV